MIKRRKGAQEPENPAEENMTEETAAEELDEELEEEETAEVEQPEEDPVKEELAKQKELYLRLAAEYENYRKRTQREKSAMGDDIRSECIGALLPVIDNLERALSAQDADADVLRKGVEMVMNQTNAIFERFGVTAFGEPGDTFDPQLHNCVSTAESEEYEEGTIILVMQKGYMLGERVVRPAMVQVAK